jgi:hypothetical protein
LEVSEGQVEAGTSIRSMRERVRIDLRQVSDG